MYHSTNYLAFVYCSSRTYTHGCMDVSDFMLTNTMMLESSILHPSLVDIFTFIHVDRLHQKEYIGARRSTHRADAILVQHLQIEYIL